MVEYINITGTNKTYYKSGDRLDPVTGKPWSGDRSTTQSILTDGSFSRYGKYFDTWDITDSDAEGRYTITSWWISNDNFYLSLPGSVRPVIYILKTPVAPTLNTSSEDKVLTLTWSSTSLMADRALIDWGDGSAETVSTSTVTHTYAEYGAYVISVTAINRCDVTSIPVTQNVVIANVVSLVKHSTIYLLDNMMRIVKPINATYRIVFTNSKTQATFTMPNDPDIRCGMRIFLYHKFHQVFVIESISGERTITVTCLDYLSSLLKGRVSYTGTDSGEGYRVYTGKGGQVIPSIITDNLSPSPRGSTAIIAPTASAIGNDISIETRYTVVSSVLEDAIKKAGLILKSTLFTVNPLLVKCELVAPSTRNINLTTRRLCGEMQSRTNIRMATTALVAGAGTGASRQTAWVGDTAATDINRVEMYVDGGESLTTTALETQSGNTVIWKLSNSSPYQIYRDFWVGDKIYVDGTLMTVTQIDMSVSTDGESINLTLGYEFDGTDKVAYNVQTGMTPSFK